ncbi:hypothetical protein C8N25_11028 [Algoriphagus antarcticus]|uniref:Uncharacterized protein n=1 Tax=Algoriphagus antarcticus TaxID=238540 RepID=A0A3E0DWL1_9BACT|nr:hypothetical protein C8N25_11028 [Algoriphagus antarcticus]
MKEPLLIIPEIFRLSKISARFKVLVFLFFTFTCINHAEASDIGPPSMVEKSHLNPPLFYAQRGKITPSLTLLHSERTSFS